MDTLKRMMEEACGKRPVAQEKDKVPVASPKTKERVEGNCFKCKKSGHWARDCKNKVAASVTEAEVAEIQQAAVEEKTTAGN